MTFRRTNRYVFEFEGERSKLQSFVRQTLVDQISQNMFEEDETAVGGAAFAIDYGMKPGALDLEKEAIVAYYRGLENPGFTLNDLKIRRRVYLFNAGEQQHSDPAIFVRDLCNGAIHNWEIIS